MEDRLPQPVHTDRDDPSPAPGELELVRSFLSLHDHSAGDGSILQPGPATVAWWLRAGDLVPSGTEVSERDFGWAMEIRGALMGKVRENMGAPADAQDDLRLNAAADETGLRPRFSEACLVPTVGGVRGAIGRLLGAAFMAELDGSWLRFRLCADPKCTTVFYDHSKNHSAKWCSMQVCGNRSKVRAFRERNSPDS